MNAKPNIIVIVGPTAAGKSSLAVDVSKRYDGEVVSADSRQVYRGLDIATGKVTEEEKQGVPHHLLDVADPEDDFNVVDYKSLAEESINEIIEKGRLPVVAGGSGFYIQAIVDNFTPPPVEPNEALRKRLQEKDTEELYAQLKKLDPRRAEDIDQHNPRRLIRAIEIAKELGKVPKKQDKEPKYNCLQIGLKLPKDELQRRIHKRTEDRLDRGMIAEAEELHHDSLSYKRMEDLGLEYRLLAQYLQGDIANKQELQEKIETGDWQYAKKQINWFKRDEGIHWFHPSEKKDIFAIIGSFLQKE